MVVMEALKPVFINGRIVETGSKFSCSPDYSRKLIENKTARLLIQEKIHDVSDERKKLESMTKDELLGLAADKGIEGLSEKNKKDEIINAILSKAE